MTQVISRFDDLRAALTGTVITPDEPGYDEAREVWNGECDRRPAVIAYCASARDVARAVSFARGASLEISVRSGGAHSIPGMSVGDAGIVIDLSRMIDVAVDPVARRATAGGGALLREVDAATQAHGLAVPLGEVGHTGLGGIATGGGMGWLTRLYGTTSDNVVAAEVVVADGRILRAAPDENPDLFWAIRGGGGNFGVVTSFELALYEVGPQVELGILFYGMADAADALRAARGAIADLPPDVTFQVVAMSAPPEPFVPPEHHGRLGVALAVVGFGPEAEHRDVVDRVRGALPPPLFALISPMPYTALQQMFDEAYAWGIRAYEKSLYIESLTDEVIDVIVDRVAATSSRMSVVHFYTLSGAYSEVDETATAFSGGRSPRLGVFIIGSAPDAEAQKVERAWTRGMFEALAPFALERGTYVNALGSDDAHRVPASYGAKFARLQQIKAVYDPDNVFHRNANILPAT